MMETWDTQSLFVEAVLMRSKHSVRKSQSRAAEFLQKPRGVLHPRVQEVGPEHFGIISIDCAKARSKWMLADFYGKVLVPPTEVVVSRPPLIMPLAVSLMLFPAVSTAMPVPTINAEPSDSLPAAIKKILPLTDEVSMAPLLVVNAPVLET